MVEGAGDKVSPMSPRNGLSLLLVNPGFEISAGEAYAGSDFSFAPFVMTGELIADFESGDPDRAAARLVNDLEPWIVGEHPGLEKIKREITKLDPAPLGVLVSGSGPTIFAIYRSDEESAEVARKIEESYPFVRASRTVI